MKKTITILASILIIAAISTGCSKHNTETVMETTTTTIATAPTTSIIEQDILHEGQFVYDTNTKIVYIKNNTYSETFPRSVLTLYLSENGNPYRYVNGKFVEIKRGE